MLKFHDVEQNNDLWLDIRAGLLTGSMVSKVMANYGKAFGEPAKRLAAEIACQTVTGRRTTAESYSNAHMERGHIQEPVARLLYEERTFTDVLSGGFFEDGKLGCSPDGRVEDDGIIEIKSVIIPVHYYNIKRNDIDPTYKWQIYFNLKLTQREWIDYISYCADFPDETKLFIHRVYADNCKEPFDMLDQRIGEFFEMVDEMKSVITGHG